MRVQHPIIVIQSPRKKIVGWLVGLWATWSDGWCLLFVFRKIGHRNIYIWVTADFQKLACGYSIYWNAVWMIAHLRDILCQTNFCRKRNRLEIHLPNENLNNVNDASSKSAYFHLKWWSEFCKITASNSWTPLNDEMALRTKRKIENQSDNL